MTRPCTTLLACFALVIAPSGVESQSPGAGTLAELPQGTRIRATGPAVRAVVKPTVGEVLQRGLASLVVRPPAEGLVVDATATSLSFVESRRDQLVDVAWSGIDFVDVHQGRSPGLGALQGAGLGALTGLAMWGVIELLFLAADNPVVEEPGVIIGIGAGAGVIVGAATLGDRWERVYGGR
jgi:hypothetical protein